MLLTNKQPFGLKVTSYITTDNRLWTFLLQNFTKFPLIWLHFNTSLLILLVTGLFKSLNLIYLVWCHFVYLIDIFTRSSVAPITIRAGPAFPGSIRSCATLDPREARIRKTAICEINTTIFLGIEHHILFFLTYVSNAKEKDLRCLGYRQYVPKFVFLTNWTL